MNSRSLDILRPIAADFARIQEIEAIVLAGSSTGIGFDELSDYDFYIYSDAEVNRNIRLAIAQKYASTYEINNQFYETGDDWELASNGKKAEFIYRSRLWIEEQVERVWIHNVASVGYTTCFIYNIRNSSIFHDKSGWYGDLQVTASSSYPDRLSDNIIKKNLPMLCDKINGSFFEQILTAITRKDTVSVNHRISVFLASYFDILFAKNKMLHPGEKKLVTYACANCEILPCGFVEDVESLMYSCNTGKEYFLCKIIKELKAIL